MRKQSIFISLLAVLCLASCTKTGDSSTGGSSPESLPPEPAKENVVNCEGFGTYKLEAEKFDSSDWISDANYGGETIISESKASGGAYLAAGAPSSSGTCTFSFVLGEYSKVVFSAAYAQMEGDIAESLEMDKTYEYVVEAVSSFTLASGKNVLPARSSATAWQLMQYEEQILYPGTYNVTLYVCDDTPKNCPSIDYVQFKTTDASAQSVDPSTITEADIPANDFRNLQQYKFLLESDLTKYKTYATGADLSAPRGIKLDLSSFGAASKYYVQISTDSTFANAPVKESSSSTYTFYNGLLGTKYYYRAADSEAGLASATAKDITLTDVAPRVCYVPNVLNFRDIGGWESELVPGAKINQGLYFRCAQLDAGRGGNTTSKLDTAGEGKAALKELGIKVDIDMRDSYNHPSSGISAANSTEWSIAFVAAAVPSGSEPVRWEGGTYQSTNIANVYKTIFETLAHCDTDPVMLHCTYGADRTGIVTFFLESLLGMSEEDMTRDYLWTQFTQGRNVKLTESDAEFPQWISKTNACEGSTFADKMENHLISFGIEKSTLEHIREIFVPGYTAQA